MRERKGGMAGTRRPSVKGRADPGSTFPPFACFQLNKQEREPQKSWSRGPWLWGRRMGGGTQEPGLLAWEGAASGPQPRRMWAAGDREGGPGRVLREEVAPAQGVAWAPTPCELCLPQGSRAPGQQTRTESGDTHPGHSPARDADGPVAETQGPGLRREGPGSLELAWRWG